MSTDVHEYGIYDIFTLIENRRWTMWVSTPCCSCCSLAVTEPTKRLCFFDTRSRVMKKIKGFMLLVLLGLVGCGATSYQPEGATGGFSDVMTAPDAAVVSFKGNGFTSALRVVEMTTLRCADLTLQRGYRYFVVTGYRDLSTNSAVTLPGYTSTNVYGNVSSLGSFTGNAYSTIMPPQTLQVSKPAVMVAIKMGNDDKVLLPFGIVAANGQRIGALDAAFMQQSIRQQLGIKTTH
jgi:hypothetical protein